MASRGATPSRGAFAAAGARTTTLVCIHDAARPLVDPVEVAAVVDAAAETGAAVAAFSAIETIKRVQPGRSWGRCRETTSWRPRRPRSSAPPCSASPSNDRARRDGRLRARRALRGRGVGRPHLALEPEDHLPGGPRLGRGLLPAGRAGALLFGSGTVSIATRWSGAERASWVGSRSRRTSGPMDTPTATSFSTPWPTRCWEPRRGEISGASSEPRSPSGRPPRRPGSSRRS